MDKLNESSTTPVLVGDLLLASSVTFGIGRPEAGRAKDGKDRRRNCGRTSVLTCYFSTPIPVGKEHVYVVTGEVCFTATSTLHCVEVETGKVVWTKEKVGRCEPRHA